MSKTILTETIDASRKPLLMENQGEFLYLKGLFLEGDVKNHNGRVYPQNEIGRAVEKINTRIKERGPVAGELDHPDGLGINFDRISHVITGMNVEGTNGIGTMRVINAGLGLIVKGCAEAGMQIGVSSRGSGEVSNDGQVSDFDIITVDIVANPSAPNAYPKMSLAESILTNKHGKESLKLTEFYHAEPRAQKFFIKSLERFFSDLVNEK